MVEEVVQYLVTLLKMVSLEVWTLVRKGEGNSVYLCNFNLVKYYILGI